MLPGLEITIGSTMMAIGFSAAELGRVARNGFESAFLPHEERRELAERMGREIAALGA